MIATIVESRARVVLLALGLAAVSASAAVAQVAVDPPVEQAPATIEGRLDLVWGMVPTLQGPPNIRVFVYDGVTQRNWEVSLDAVVANRAGGLLGLNGKIVRLALRQEQGFAAAGALPMVTSVLGVTPDLGGRRVPDVSAHAGLLAAPAGAPPVSGSRRYAALLCKFADEPVEPGTQAEYTNFLFGATASVEHFWREVSEQRVDFTGSVVTVWVTMAQPRAYYFPGGATNADLGRLAQDCTAAADLIVDFTQFFGIIAQFNRSLGCCGWGGGRTMTLDGVTRNWAFAWMPGSSAVPTSMGFYAHEVGHSLGLPHSGGPYGRTYDSRWDVMSASSAYNNTAINRTHGAHTIGYHKDLLGWIPPARRYIATEASTTVTLERHALPGANGNAQVIVIPIRGTNTFYTAEARLRAGYDGLIALEGVVIHHVEPTTSRTEPAWVVDPDGNGNTNDAGAVWTVGESFVDARYGISVTVESRVGDAFVVRVRNGGVTSLALGTAGRSTTVVAGAAAANDSVDVRLSGAASAVTSWTAAKQSFRGGWISFNTSSGTGPGQLRLRRDPTGLGAGAYVDTVLVRAGLDTARYVDTLVVQAPAALYLGLSVTSRRDSVLAPYGVVDSADVIITGPGATTAAWTAAKRRSTTSITTSSGTGPGRVRWTRAAFGNPPPGVYVDTITVTLTASPTALATIIDTFRLTEPMNYTVGVPTRRDSVPEGAMPVLDSVSVALNGLWATGGSWSVAVNSYWLNRKHLRPVPLVNSRIGPGFAVWQRGSPLLAVGLHIDTVRIRAHWWWFAVPSTGHQGEYLIVDTLRVYAAPLAMALSKSSSRDTIAGGLRASADSVVVLMTGTGSASASWAMTSLRGRSVPVANGGFATPGSSVGSGWLGWVRNVAGLAPGTYVDTLRFTSTALAGVMRDLIDTTVVLPGIAVALDGTSRRDSSVFGAVGLRPDSALVDLLGVSGTTLAWSATHTASWSALTSSSGTGSGRLRWTRDPAGLGIGMWVDTIRVTAGGGLNAMLVDTFLIRAAGSLFATSVLLPDSIVSRDGATITTQLRIDMTSSGASLGSYAATLTWDSMVMRLDSVRPVAGAFVGPTITTVHGGETRLTAVSIAGASGVVALADLYFGIVGDSAGDRTNLVQAFTDLRAAGSGASLVGILGVRPARVFSAGSLRGDATRDGLITAADALAVLQAVVNLALPAGVKAVPNGDANCNGRIEALDALIVLSQVVGLPVTQFCVGTVR